MRCRFLTAEIVYPVYRSSVEGAVLVVEHDGRIREFVHSAESPDLHAQLLEHPDLERYKGALVPGLINSHCHLELSFAKDLIPPGTGLPGFLKGVTSLRGHDPDAALVAMQAADEAMQRAGIVAIGDISNTAASIAVKSASRLRYHTFVEIFDLSPDRSMEVLKNGHELLRTFEAAGLAASLSPHATYTVSAELAVRLFELAATRNWQLTIHNQETVSEDEFFQTGTGSLSTFLQSTGKYDAWMPTGMSALLSFMKHSTANQKMLLVHNTYTSKRDINWITQQFPATWWCLCPKANLFIERRLPDTRSLFHQGCKVVIGTDSLASNDSLSLTEEMERLLQSDDSITFDDVLYAATAQAAEFFGWSDELGDFQAGKQPGVVWLEEVNPSIGKIKVGGVLLPAQ